MFLARMAPVLAACLLTLSSHATEPLSPEALAEGRVLRERALVDDTAYELIRSLTTEVGPRLPGSPGDARAVEWSVARLKALGGSIGTPPQGIEAEVVPVTTLEELKAQPRERIAGRIVFFTARMERSRDGSGYGKTVPPRGSGAAEADGGFGRLPVAGTPVP